MRVKNTNFTTPLERHMVRSAFSTTLWQCAFTRHFRFFQIVLPPVNPTSMGWKDPSATIFMMPEGLFLFFVLEVAKI
jgi:hypothetical protein